MPFYSATTLNGYSPISEVAVHFCVAAFREHEKVGRRKEN